MTSTDNKNSIAFYIFKQDDEGNSLRVGTAFHHKKGKGINILIGDIRYTAFPPKFKPDEEESA